jgi:hypothetical protein
MAAVVAIYYGWPAGAAVLSRYAAWQHAGGVLVAALATAFAGGVLSQVSLVYFQKRGRWTESDLKNMAFRWALFFISGAIVYEFYGWQAVWWGQGPGWSVLIPKVLLDQFGYTVFVATPLFSLSLRWQTLNFSGKRLWKELDQSFLTERMLPILVTNWMFWIPGVSLIYSMPSILQTPLFIFATAIWGLLLPAVTKQERNHALDSALCPAPDGLISPVE